MKENLKILRQKFEEIKNSGAIKSLRKGSTGVGYTFEYLLNKNEDKESKPDFLGIELKTKLGYSKSPITLFNCAPKRKKLSATNYIFDNYSYPKYKNHNIYVFERDIFANKFIKNYNYQFKLFVDYYNQRIIMKSFFKTYYKEDVCYWSFKDLERKLKGKLTYLAIVKAYPYKYDNILYYKYLKLTTYKLKGFFEFLKLIETGKIHINVYLKKDKLIESNQNIENHGFAFRINNNYIEELFYKLYY